MLAVVISTMMIVYIGLHIANGMILIINVKILLIMIPIQIMVLLNLVPSMNQMA